MPLAFPSHQGLILPLQRRFPARIDALVLCVGAALPDVVEACAWPFRGELGQWAGHSLLGVGACALAGWGLAWLLRPRVRVPARLGLASAAIGALSHVLFDLVTHGNFLLLWPWYANDRLFPSWWYHAWGSLPLPVYDEPYPLAPHTVAWVVLSLLGAWLFIRLVRRPDDRARPRPPRTTR